jgi:hypothetical protein
MMLAGWTLSCATVLYNVHELTDTDPQANGFVPASALQPSNSVHAGNQRNDKLAVDPVIPSIERLRSYDGTVVEPPFVPPPDAKHRKWNYWMMCQRCASLSYLTFGAGFSLVDQRTFSLASTLTGTFPLDFNQTVYILRLMFALIGLLCLTLIVYAVCRLLERRGWYIRV